MRRKFGLLGVVVNQDVLEDGRVEDAALVRLRGLVATVVAAGEAQRLIEALHDAVDLVVSDGLPAQGVGLLGLDPVLLRLHDLVGDAAAVVELHELLLLGDEVGEAALVVRGVPSGLGDVAVGDLLDEPAHGGPLIAGEQVVGVDGLEVRFDVRETQVADTAWSVGCDAAETGVVLVALPGLAAAAAVAPAVGAAFADQQAGEVVVVFAAAAGGADAA